ARAHRGQDALGLRYRRLRIVGVLDVGEAEAGELDRLAGRQEPRIVDRQHDARALAVRVLHLASDRALPDEVVDLPLVVAQALRQLARVLEARAGWADRLVGLLRVAHLGAVQARLGGQVFGAEVLLDVRARRLERLVGEVGRVGAHVGDEPVLVEPLRGAHRPLRGEAQLAPGLLLQRARGERRRGPLDVRLAVDALDTGRVDAQPCDQGLGLGLIELQRLILARTQLPGVGVEVLAGRDPPPADALQGGAELRGVRDERAVEVEVGRRHEAHALAFALDDQAHRDALHAAGGQARPDLLPQQRRHRIAVQPVDDAPRLLRLDQVLVDPARMRERLADRLFGDLVEYE